MSREPFSIWVEASRPIRKGSPIKLAKHSGKASSMPMTHSRLVGFAMNDAKKGETVRIALAGTLVIPDWLIPE